MKQAIIKQINESFKIDDFDNELDTTVHGKQKVQKGSKIFQKVKTLYNKVGKSNLLSALFKHRELLMDVFMDEQSLDFLKSILTDDEWQAIQIESIVYKIKFKQPLSDVEMQMVDVLQHVNSKEHPLYACYDFGDYPIEEFIHNAISDEYFGIHGNFNWIDVSRVTCFDYMFETDDYDDESGIIAASDCSRFDGDISLWNVSSAKSMIDMFSSSAFTGDISKWNIPDDCLVVHMVAYSNIPDKHRPYYLKSNMDRYADEIDIHVGELKMLASDGRLPFKKSTRGHR